MTTSTLPRKLFLALCGNAVLLGLILLSMWTRGPASPAMAQVPPATMAMAAATANGLTIMPAQLSPQTYGCYLLDADRQTLCVYEMFPGDPELRLLAARDVQYDRQLKVFNTTPRPTDTQRIAERAAQRPRTVPHAPDDAGHDAPQ